MKPRIVALMLLASMLLLVGLIPAAGAQTAVQEQPTIPDLALRQQRAAAREAARQSDTPPPATAGEPIDALRLERHPEEKARLDRPTAAPTAGAPAAPMLSASSVLPLSSPEPGTAVVITSVDDMGRNGNSDSNDPALSDDGRYVAFASSPDNLVPGDWNEVRDIFVRDTQTNTTERVSVSTAGDEGNGSSWQPSISADGRYVVFYSSADNLVNDDLNWSSDAFLHDRQTGATTLISRHSDGTQGNWDSYDPVISADGAFVAYYSYADNLVDNDENGSISDVFLYEVTTGQTTLISRHSDGTQNNGGAYSPAISADGSFIAFVSYADDLVDADTNGYEDIFVRDVAGGTTTLVSRHTDGTQGDDWSYSPSISADGQIVAYSSYAGNLVDDDANGAGDVFVYDMQAGTTTMVSRHSDGTPGNWDSYDQALSGNGRYVLFFSCADNLMDADANEGGCDVFLHDLQTGATTLASRSATGEQGDWSSFSPAINNDGSVIAFGSMATNLVFSGWDGWATDIFVRYTGLADLYSISGRVTDEFDNGLGWEIVRDVSGATVYTDNDGYYTLDTLLPGDHGVWAWDEGYYYLFPTTPAAVTLPPNAVDVDIQGQTNDYYGGEFPAVADAYVDEAKKTKNYGLQPYLRVKNAAKDLNSYLKFEVAGLPSCPSVDYAEVRLFATDGGPDAGTLYRTGNDWTEAGINWNNAPALGDYLDGSWSVDNNQYNWFYLDDVNRNGAYSYALRNNSSNQVQYDSGEGVDPPILYVYWLQKPELMPDAQYGMDVTEGLAPVTVRFTDQSEGCPTSWYWEFGDGATSTDPNPTHTYTDPGYYEVVLTVSNSEGQDRKTQWVNVIEPPSLFYLSLSKKYQIGPMTVEPADIVRYNKIADTWTMVYDGSAHGTNTNIGSFAWDDNDLLLVFSGNQTIPGLGKATQYDVVRFTPDNPGAFPLGPGTFSWEFQGKTNGLSTGSEKIDALDQFWGERYFSTTGTASLPITPVLKPADEDLFIWYSWGEWYSGLMLDGSTIPGMAAEDINGVWYDDWTGDYYVAILGKFNLGGVAGDDASIVRINWNGSSYIPSLVDWLAPGAPVFKGKIDGLEMSR